MLYVHYSESKDSSQDGLNCCNCPKKIDDRHRLIT